MTLRKIVRFICFALIFLPAPFPAAAEDFTNAIHAFLQHRVEVEKKDVGIVVGLVDERGSRIVSCGKMDNGTALEVNGDTIFNIRSMTCTFTGLLLQDMIERGEMKLDDPVAKYLPKLVKMPTRNGKEITLRHLVAETSGIESAISNLDPKRADNPLADYTIEKMYAFLSGYKLTCDPGAKHEHGGVAMGLLGDVIALKAGTNYESLVVDRICWPLKMDSTRFTLAPELKARFATGHNQFGYAVPTVDMGVLMPLGGLRSTANDMLKFISANLGLMPTGLTPLMEKNVMIMGFDPLGSGIIHLSGGGFGFRSYACYDKTRRRGVVVLSNVFNSEDYDDVRYLGNLLLESEWQLNQRPQETKISSQVYGSYVGQYQRSSDSVHSQPGIGIRLERDRLFAQATELELPPNAELLPQSETRFFERMSSMPITFSRNAQGKVIGLTALCRGNVLSYEKISDQPPEVPEPPKPHVAIKLDTKHLDTIVGRYEVAPNAELPTGVKLTIWRHGDQLVGQAWGENVLQGAFNMYPESETNFFDKITGAQLIFIKNDKGEVTAVVHHEVGLPDIKGKKLKNE